MAERKAMSVTIAIEPTLLEITREHTDNISYLLRSLLIAHLLEKGHIDMPTLTKILV